MSPISDQKANSFPSHQRKASQPDNFEKKVSEHKPYSHQRNPSQPDYMYTEVGQSFAQNRPNKVANAQALVQFLPQSEQKLLQHKQNVTERSDEEFMQNLHKFTMCPTQKTEDQFPKPTKSIISHGQFQQSTKKLEELLSQRLEKESIGKRNQCMITGESSQDIEQKMNIQKQINQKLQADLQQTVKQIQEKQSIELRLPQNRKWSEVCRFYFI